VRLLKESARERDSLAVVFAVLSSMPLIVLALHKVVTAEVMALDAIT
jgi:hypothetical protein